MQKRTSGEIAGGLERQGGCEVRVVFIYFVLLHGEQADVASV
jgi:hypothetical protein